MPLVMPLVGRKFLSVVVGLLVLAPALGQEASGSPSEQPVIQSNSESNADLSAVVEYLGELLTKGDPDWHFPDEPFRLTIALWANDAKTGKISLMSAVTQASIWRNQGRVSLTFRRSPSGVAGPDDRLMHDRAINADCSWAARDQSIVIQPTHGQLGESVLKDISDVKHTCRRMAMQGLDGLDGFRWTFGSIRGGPEGWSAVWSAADPVADMKIEGRGDDPTDIKIDRVSFREGRESSGAAWVLASSCDDHRLLPWVDRYIAGRLSLFDSDGSESNRYEVWEITTLSAEQFAAAVKAPDPSDPPETTTVVTDMRGLRKKSWVRQNGVMVELASEWQYRKLVVPGLIFVACALSAGIAWVLIRRRSAS